MSVFGQISLTFGISFCFCFPEQTVVTYGKEQQNLSREVGPHDPWGPLQPGILWFYGSYFPAHLYVVEPCEPYDSFILDFTGDFLLRELTLFFPPPHLFDLSFLCVRLIPLSLLSSFWPFGEGQTSSEFQTDNFTWFPHPSCCVISWRGEFFEVKIYSYKTFVTWSAFCIYPHVHQLRSAL